MADTNIAALNDVIATLGGEGGHTRNIDAYNEWATLVGAAGGHTYNINALNAIAVALGAAGGHLRKIDALNAIAVVLGDAGGHTRNLAALNAIAPISQSNAAPTAITITPPSTVMMLNGEVLQLNGEDLILNDGVLFENAALGTVVGSLTATDEDVGDTHTFTLLDDADGRFSISGTDLIVSGALLAGSYDIEIEVSDGDATYSDEFTITVTDLPEEAEEEAIPAYLPSDTEDMAAWFVANDDYLTHSANAISQWSDKSGNGNHIVQATGSSQPTRIAAGLDNGTTVRFATDDVLRCASPSEHITGTDKIAFAVLINFDSTSTEGVFEFGSTINQGPQLMVESNSLYVRHTGTGSAIASTSFTDTTNWQIITGYIGVDRRSIRLNGDATVATETDTTAHEITEFRIGSLVGTYFLDADVKELIFYNRDMTDAEFANLEGYLQHEYGLTRLVPGHPYETTPPSGPAAMPVPDGTIVDDGAFTTPPVATEVNSQIKFNGKKASGSAGKFVYDIGPPAPGVSYIIQYDPDWSLLANDGVTAMVGFVMKAGNDFDMVGLKGSGPAEALGLNGDTLAVNGEELGIYPRVHAYQIGGDGKWNQTSGFTTDDGSSAAHGTVDGPNWVKLAVATDGSTYTFSTSADGITWDAEYTAVTPASLGSVTAATTFGIGVFLEAADAGNFLLDITYWRTGGPYVRLASEWVEVISQPVALVNVASEWAEVISVPVAQVNVASEWAEVISVPVAQVNVASEWAEVIGPDSSPAAPTGKRFWKLTFTGITGPGNIAAIAELEYRIAGVDQTGSGRAFANSVYDTTNYAAALAFNNVTDSGGNGQVWATADGFASSAWLAYDFGAGQDKAIDAIAVTGRATAGLGQNPTGFTIHSSPDNHTWTLEKTVSSLTWTSNEQKIIAIP